MCVLNCFIIILIIIIIEPNKVHTCRLTKTYNNN